MQSIISQLAISPIKKSIFLKLAKIYQLNLPDSLYLNPYELTELLPSSTPQDWKSFLAIPEINRFIESEIATIAEAAARKALQNLQDNPTSQDISAAKELLQSSRLLKQKLQNKQTVIMTYLPPIQTQ